MKLPFRLTLASASPRRTQLLTTAGIPHQVRVAGIDEVRHEDEDATEFVNRMANEKALALTLAPREVVLAADTVVSVDEEVLIKPVSSADLHRMIRLLSGRTHEVLTAFCLRTTREVILETAITDVSFYELSADEINEYVETGEGFDKAGGYGIQGLASRFVREIRGSYDNVVGLPVALVYRHLRQLAAQADHGHMGQIPYS